MLQGKGTHAGSFLHKYRCRVGDGYHGQMIRLYKEFTPLTINAKLPSGYFTTWYQITIHQKCTQLMMTLDDVL